MRRVFSLLAVLCATPAVAQTLEGPAIAVDGDTLAMSGQRLRLFGIDAPESMQTCDRGGVAWSCGEGAKRLLAQMIEGRAVNCTARDRDHDGRIVATCHAGNSDLAAVMVREGLAITLPQFTSEYASLEARAKQFKLALWGSRFQTPGQFREANPTLFAAPLSQSVQLVAARPAAPRAPTIVSTWSFRNCAAARAAGAAPLYRGKPGYGAHMDGDGDGIACEPYRR